ncbi:VanZ family protein [Streptomyces rapamycinicus]|uniref:VanZ-like domain-containing protein n=1 Tax=Streptomyces rapamycinicus TaxID=1226757 RepID=A0ABR6LQR2_9ACTN|nr:VanZ family protein [Streptomyces rapamycinicus]AGP57053.1 hypothetical protein M271_27950 [Streptomyces rapamycinicus NRRL 5491]MBB4784686.1 hypothetical protein [Streptomyces rapamycinicus]
MTAKKESAKSSTAKARTEKGRTEKGRTEKGRTGTGQPAKGRATKGQSAKTPTAKSRSTQVQPTQAQPTQAQPTKAQPTKAQPTKAQPTQAQPSKGRTVEPGEPQGAPEKALLQRTSFGARLARAMVLLLAFVCMVGFAAALAKATLVPSPGSVDLVHTNLHPGRSLRAYVDQPAFQDTVKQIGGNVLLGAPFGVLLPMLVPKARGAVRVVVVTALVMVAVETVQGLIVEGRAFDIDDVILNTSGALIGYVVAGRWLGHALHPRRRHWWHRWTRRGTEAPPAA